MTDLDAIRARHAGRHVCGGSDGHVAIYEDGRCDAAIVLAALDEADAMWDEAVSLGKQYRIERDAAIEREARLRAALEYIAHLHPSRVAEAPGIAKHNLVRAALAQVGSEGTDG